MIPVMDLQARLDGLPIRSVSDRRPQYVGKLDLSRHNNLRDRIMQYKWNESVNIGYDIGLVSATVGYFVDNPNELLEPEYNYLFEKNLEEDDDKRGCMSHVETNLIQSLMMIIAFNRNRYYRSEEKRHDVGQDEAEQDFLVNRSGDFARRARNALCAICTQSPSCGMGQFYLKKFIESFPETSS